jgi:hypothetical protein
LLLFLGKYTLQKTAVDFEIAVSNNDANLFSTDDSNNQGVSAKHQTTVAFKKNGLPMPSQLSIYPKEFRSVERLYTIEFDRDWNLETTAVGNQSLLVTGLHLNLGPTANNIGILKYQFENWISLKAFLETDIV